MTPDQPSNTSYPRSFEELPPASPLKKSLQAYFERMGQPHLATTEDLPPDTSDEVRRTVRSALDAVRCAEQGTPTDYSTSEPSIRWTLHRDIEDISTIEEGTFRPPLLPLNRSAFVHHRRKWEVIGRIAVEPPLTEDNTAIGHILYALRRGTAQILSAAVLPSHRGRGVAEHLVVKVVDGLAKPSRKSRTTLTETIRETHSVSPVFSPDLLRKLLTATDPEQIALRQAQLSESLALFDDRAPLKEELRRFLAPLFTTPPSDLPSLWKQGLQERVDAASCLMDCLAFLTHEDPWSLGNAGRNPADGPLRLQDSEERKGGQPVHHLNAIAREDDLEGFAAYRIDPKTSTLILDRFITYAPLEQRGVGVELAAALLKQVREANLSHVELRLNKF